jgi:hypothetical protein
MRRYGSLNVRGRHAPSASIPTWRWLGEHVPHEHTRTPRGAQLLNIAAQEDVVLSPVCVD